MAYMTEELTVGASSDYFLAQGYCDILISGLTSGTVTLQALFPGETVPIDIPGMEFSYDIWSTLFVSEDQVFLRFTGDGNNTCTVRIGRDLND